MTRRRSIRWPTSCRPPLEQCEDEGTADEVESGHESDSDGHHDSSSTDDSDDSSSSSQPDNVNECSVCEAEPKRMEQVWNLSCHHGFCGDCMHVLSSKDRAGDRRKRQGTTNGAKWWKG
jgi:hypothetical protein